MNTISQSEILLQDATNEVGAFLRKYQVSNILKQCNGYKQWRLWFMFTSICCVLLVVLDILGVPID